MIARAAGLLACTAVLVSCDESLPPRDDPQNFLSAAFQAPTRVVVIDSGRVQSGLNLLVTLRNNYTEVFQDVADIRGPVVVFMTARPDARQTLPITSPHLVTSWMLRGGLFTIGVDSAALFGVPWSQVMDGGTEFWRTVPLHLRFSSGGAPYWESDSVRFTAQGSVKVFEKVPGISWPTIQFVIIYQIFDTTIEPPT
jgi:hypothetical protein